MTRKLGPWIGVLLFLGAAFTARAFDVPREALIEVARPVDVVADATGATHTGLPDLDALISQYRGALTQYAVQTSVRRRGDFKRYLLVRLDPTQERDMPTFLERLSHLTSVRWAQANHFLHPCFTPNDPLFSSQWGLASVRAQAAWDVTRGLGIVGSDTIRIPIAIIDTGCQMDHPDLAPSFWTNTGEIPNNGIDDDNNGFIDDIHGWDFVDAPSFPSSGDYLIRDNDPSDENGHGTSIAGIIGAAMDNGIGVAGLAPACPLMILRAGNADGYLQEDDVASAIMYALENGARVVNMSFGDTQASPMLESVINYAAQNGLMMVAASGNYGNNTIIYPAAFGPVLCVGAINQNGVRASFSSYGTPLDLMAPGTDIVSTLMGSGYGSAGSGTSFASAFASAAAGLVLSQHPDWDPPMVMSVLKSSCDDIGAPGWDPQTGQGILRADKAVQVGDALVAQISSPVMGQGFAQTDSLVIRGTAAGVYLQSWWVLSGIGENPVAWDTIQAAGNLQHVNDTLAVWHNSQPVDTAYTIRLGVEDIFGRLVDDRVVIYYDPSPPVISNLSMVPILDGDRPSFLLRFHTDDMTTGKLWLTPQSGLLLKRFSLTLNYVTQDHVLLIGQSLSPQLYDYSLIVTNSSGLNDSLSNLGSVDLRTVSIATNNFVEQLPCNLPPGYLYESATDLDSDNFLEVWQDSLTAKFSKDSLFVWESATGATFNKLNLSYGLQIPKSIGICPTNGQPELLTTYGGTTKIFEAATPNGFPQPDNPVWLNSGDWWGVKFLDPFPGVNHGDVLLEHQNKYKLYANNGAGNLTLLQDLTDPFGGTQSIQPLYCRQGDFDGDGKTDLLFGNDYGHLYIYEQQAGSEFLQTGPVWIDSTGLLDDGEFLASGDWDGDGRTEFACLAHTETVLPGEHLADTRYWTLFVFKHGTGDNQYVPMDTLYFFGARDPSEFASGISSGDVYGDSRPELILCLYPHLYVLGWDQGLGKFTTLWYYPQCRSNKAVIGDFNRDGHADFIFNTGIQTRMFTAAGATQLPPPPLDFHVQPLLPPRIHLSWSPVAGALAYNVYRATHPAPLSLLGETSATDTTDFSVVMDTTYYYAITTVSLQGEGPSTVALAATPNALPTIIGDTAHFVWPQYVILDFSEPMNNSILDPNNYYVYNPATQLIQPTSIVSSQGGKQAVLTFAPVFHDSLQYHIIIDTLFDLQGSPLVRAPSDTLRFTANAAAQSPPYLVSANGNISHGLVVLIFSQAMSNLDLPVKTHYSITADVTTPSPQNDSLKIYDILVDPNLTTVKLEIDPSTPLKSQNYRVEVAV